MTSRFYDCSVSECANASIRGAGGCESCNRQFCTKHIKPPYHLCNQDIDDAKWHAQIVAELHRLRTRINDAEVCKLASQLNTGRNCVIEYSSGVGAGALMGAANYHARILFVDGSPSWLLRVPRVASAGVGFPEHLAAWLIRSEFATLKFLETTAIPAPRAFDCGVPADGTDHDIGVTFLLMEELPGKPWDGRRVDGTEATEEERLKVWNAVADILAELAKHPFPKAGSLHLVGSTIEVSEFASDRFVVLDPYGPFDNATAYYTAWVEQYMNLIADGQLCTEYSVDAYLVYQFLKDNIHQLFPAESKKEKPEQFFLKHVDDKGDHLLVDENLNVTGIIDWQMARTVPIAEAFAMSFVTADMQALSYGKTSLSKDDQALRHILQEKGHHRLAQYMTDEKIRRFFWGLAMEPDWNYALPLAEALLETFGVDQLWEQWREQALIKSRGDERFQKLLRLAKVES